MALISNLTSVHSISTRSDQMFARDCFHFLDNRLETWVFPLFVRCFHHDVAVHREENEKTLKFAFLPSMFAGSPCKISHVVSHSHLLCWVAVAVGVESATSFSFYIYNIWKFELRRKKIKFLWHWKNINNFVYVWQIGSGQMCYWKEKISKKLHNL